MVTILGVSFFKRNRFISLRWKLVSTYLLLIVIFLIIINILTASIFLNSYIEQAKVETLANANIISNSIDGFLNNGYFDLFFEINDLQARIETYSKEISSRVLIVDKRSIVIADSTDIYKGVVLKHIEIQNALEGTTEVEIYNFKGIGHVMYVSVPIIIDNEVVGATFISTSLTGVYGRVNEIRRILNLIALLSSIFIAIISFVLADIFTNPIKKFTRAIKRMAQGDLGQKVEIKANDEFKQLATSFNIMSTKIDQVDTQRKDFVANVSHELRTPLSSMKLLSEALLLQDETNVKIYKEFLSDIDSEIDRLNNIIDDLLTLVDLDKEKLSLNYKTTYVNFFLEKIISRLKPLAQKKNIELVFIEIEKVQIKMDANKIKQAVINILHNAIKYTSNGGKVKIILYTRDRHTIIKIKDNGIGIPKENLPYIFERFYRVDKARNRNTGGTGLGLSIANQIVNLHQGKIEVESKVGKGTSFYIKIPYSIDVI